MGGPYAMCNREPHLPVLEANSEQAVVIVL